MLEQTTTELESKHKLASTQLETLVAAIPVQNSKAFLKGKQILEAALASAVGERVWKSKGVSGSSGQWKRSSDS